MSGKASPPKAIAMNENAMAITQTIGTAHDLRLICFISSSSTIACDHFVSLANRISPHPKLADRGESKRARVQNERRSAVIVLAKERGWKGNKGDE
jgi:hypothetical protein